MKKINDEKWECRGALQKKDIKRLVVSPLSRRINNQAFAGMKLNRRSFKKLQDVEKQIEIIAREIARQSKSKK